MTISEIRIETKRLIMRPPVADDLDDWAVFHGHEKTMTHLGGAKTRAESWRSLCEMAGAWHIRGYAMFSLVLKDSGKWIGRIGPWYPEGWPGTEVGWGIAPEYTGKGYALEAAAASMDYAVDELGWNDICHTIAPDNLESIALARRLGSANRGGTQLPPPHQDFPVDNWGQSRDEWQKNRKNFI